MLHSLLHMRPPSCHSGVPEWHPQLLRKATTLATGGCTRKAQPSFLPTLLQHHLSGHLMGVKLIRLRLSDGLCVLYKYSRHNLGTSAARYSSSITTRRCTHRVPNLAICWAQQFAMLAACPRPAQPPTEDPTKGGTCPKAEGKRPKAKG